MNVLLVITCLQWLDINLFQIYNGQLYYSIIVVSFSVYTLLTKHSKNSNKK